MSTSVRWTHWPQMRSGSVSGSTPRRPHTPSLSLWLRSLVKGGGSFRYEASTILIIQGKVTNFFLQMTRPWTGCDTGDVEKHKQIFSTFDVNKGNANAKKTYLLWRDVKGHSPQINFHKVISAGQNKEES